MLSLNKILSSLGSNCFSTIKINEGVEEDLENLNSDFTLDKGTETYLLKGNYVIAKVLDEDKSEKDEVPHYHCKLVFSIGYVLFNKDTPNIENLIKLIIYYTSNSPPEKTTQRKQMRGGTICPSEEIICEVDGKQFILFGRYIFGYDHQFVKFKSEKKGFKLNAIKGKERENDYNYAFAIIDKNTKVLDAFGLYC